VLGNHAPKGRFRDLRALGASIKQGAVIGLNGLFWLVSGARKGVPKVMGNYADNSPPID
jgi:hypothetical protein